MYSGFSCRTRSSSPGRLGDDHVPVEPVERFLAYLASIERSPNTIKAYAHDLKDWLTYLDGHASTGSP